MTRPCILIIAHDPAMVVLFEDILRDAGYHTDVWTRCAGAVAHIRQAQPQGVLLSLWLEQRGDGWTVLQELREDVATAPLPVIICTGDQQALEDEAAQYVDARCHIVLKPFEVDTLLATVHTALQGDAALRCREVGT